MLIVGLERSCLPELQPYILGAVDVFFACILQRESRNTSGSNCGVVRHEVRNKMSRSLRFLVLRPSSNTHLRSHSLLKAEAEYPYSVQSSAVG